MVTGTVAQQSRHGSSSPDDNERHALRERDAVSPFSICNPPHDWNENSMIRRRWSWYFFSDEKSSDLEKETKKKVEERNMACIC